MVKEWAKLRWGVYDELPRDPVRESYYYYTNRIILPTICSSSIEGTLELEKSFVLKWFVISRLIVKVLLGRQLN